MIDKSQLSFCLRPKTLVTAFALSGGLFSVLLVAWSACALAGVVSVAACWLVIVIMAVLVYGIVIVIALTFLGIGLAIADAGSKKGNNKAGWAALIGLALGIGFLFYGFPWSTRITRGVVADFHGSAMTAWNHCLNFGRLFWDAFIDYQVYLYAWSVFAGALLAAALVLFVLVLLRCETWAKAAFRQIRYSCPKCHSQTLPRFCCSNPGCAFPHEDLWPTIYGVWKAKCGKCDTLLPASDLAGRLKLKSICGEKGCDPDFASLGSHSEYHLAVVGASNSGKTNLMIMALRQLIESFAPAHGITVRFANPGEEHEFYQKVRDLDEGRALGSTVRVETPMAFNLVLQPAQGPASTLYIYDAAGEDYQTGDTALTGHRFHRYVDAILLVVDPSAEEEMRRQFPAVDWNSMNPARESISLIEGRMIPFWERALGVGAGQPFGVPLAVVVTKMDGLSAHFTSQADDLRGSYPDMENAGATAARESDAVRKFLIDGGLASLVDNLEARFPHAAFFAVSALGRANQPSDRSAFQSRGVLAPLFWACHSAGALSDASSLARSLRHVGKYTVRMLKGREGLWGAFTLWSVLATAVAGIVMLSWYLADTWGLVAALSGLALLALFGYGKVILSPNDRQRFRQELRESTRRMRARFVGQHGKRTQFLTWGGAFFLVVMLFVGAWHLWWPLIFVVPILVFATALRIRRAV